MSLSTDLRIHPFAASTLTYLWISETIPLSVPGKGITEQALKMLNIKISNMKICGASTKTLVLKKLPLSTKAQIPTRKLRQNTLLK